MLSSRAQVLAWLSVVMLCTSAVARSESRRARSSRAACPIGFTSARIDGDHICYRLKEPESFDEKYVGCAGNMYSSQQLRRADFTIPNERLWADYVNLYPGGPFVDWSYRESTGEIFENTYDVRYSPEQFEEDLCTVREPSGNITAVLCSEKHYRLCVVKPYDDVKRDGCGEGYFRLQSPVPSCLMNVMGVGGSAVRATWKQAQGMCERRDGKLLQRGWRYGDHPALHSSTVAVPGDTEEATPLGIYMTRGDGLTWSTHIEGESDLVPQSEWSFPPEEKFAPDTEWVALVAQRWKMVNESYVFYEVVCEQPVALTAFTMTLTYTVERRLELNVSDANVDKKDITCLTDSASFPKTKRVDISRVGHSSFVLEPEKDGYYWCVVSNLTGYLPGESNKELYVQTKQSVVNQYAIKIRINEKYNIKDARRVENNIRDKLSDYIYMYSKYVQVNGKAVSNVNLTEKVLAEFSGQELDVSKEDVIYDWKLKRVYLDRQTMLFHAKINEVMFPLIAAQWREIKVLFMKPVYFCQAFDSVPMLPLGQEITLEGTTYECEGDFNEGVQWLEFSEPTQPPRATTLPLNTTVLVENPTTATEAPSTIVTTEASYTTTETQSENIQKKAAVGPPIALPSATDSSEYTTTTESSEEEDISTQTTALLVTPERPSTATLSTEVVSTAGKPPPVTPLPPPTTTPNTTEPPSTAPPTRPPEDLMLEVLENLENMLQEDAGPITSEHLQTATSQVNDILELESEAEIPGRILQLIDEVGARMELNGSQSAAEVRDNIGLVVADSAPGAPVRGLRLAYSGADALTENTFHIITGDVNDSYMNWNTSEVLVNLPESLADAERRITFVVFRNNRAFHSAAQPDQRPVNSRVLSVTVSNFSKSFDDGEYIDIHLRPTDPDVPRDSRRTCGYWHFNTDDTGFWSQEGCTFIPSRAGAGRLDVCRCTHLTHFAEILTPRTVFSEADESALEIISIIGCFLSMIGLIMIGLTAAMFRAWRRDFGNKVWLQLSAATFLLAVAFLIVAFSDFERFSPLCMLSGVVLHYATLASFCWMVVSAILSYRRLVLVFVREASHKLLRACAFAWGVPCAIVGILLAVDPTAYSGRFTEVENTTASFCYPSGLALWLTVYAPVAIALIANWTLFALIIRSVFASRSIKRHGDTNEALRCATVSFLLVFLFGLPWLFGLFSTLLAFAYLFALTATYQGLVLFLFFVVGNKKTRDMWFNVLKIKQTQKVPVTSSSYKSNGWRSGGPGGGGVMASSSSGVAAMEEASAKPRSLSGRDDIARFS